MKFKFAIKISFVIVFCSILFILVYSYWSLPSLTMRASQYFFVFPKFIFADNSENQTTCTCTMYILSLWLLGRYLQDKVFHEYINIVEAWLWDPNSTLKHKSAQRSALLYTRSCSSPMPVNVTFSFPLQMDTMLFVVEWPSMPT